MFNKGGITRVLGRPSILELIYMPNLGSKCLELFQSFLDSTDQSEWRRMTSIPKDPSDNQAKFETLAPTPNLSLNVGIIQRPRWVFYAIAAAGLLLQSSALALAGVGVWVLGWNLNADASSAEHDYAPTMFILGTVLMSAGMWSCAALIGQTTHEIRYKRQGQPDDWTSELMWLQPGPQVIGDQSFDPFAFFEERGKRLKVWTSSTKDLSKKYELHTWAAILMVLVGYIMQFIGLRGMVASISLTQLGITLLMSFLRGLLRAQRLNKNDNKLRGMPDLVARRELDWLAFEVVGRSADKPNPDHKPVWRFDGGYSAAIEPRRYGESPIVSRPYIITARDSDLSKVESEAAQPAQNDWINARSQKKVLKFEDLLYFRGKLAHLTGHTITPYPWVAKVSEGQKWKDDYVQVRTHARKISTAVCQAAKSLDATRRAKRYELPLQVLSAVNDGGTDSQLRLVDIFVPLSSPDNSTLATWKIDSALLEGILGLWMWSLVCNPDHVGYDNFGNKHSIAEKFQRSRIVAADVLSKPKIQPEMNLWLGPDTLGVHAGHINIPQDGNHPGLADIWDNGGDGIWWDRITGKISKSPYSELRFSGWNLVHKALSEPRIAVQLADEDSYIAVHFEHVLTEQSLLGVCAQELFTALIMSFISLVSVGQTTVLESGGYVRLQNPVVSSVARAFTEAELGSHSDAYSCIVPALGERCRPSYSHLLDELFKASDTYRKQSEWERAEILLKWACRSRYEGGLRQNPFRGTANDGSYPSRIVRQIGELYRWSLASYNIGDRMAEQRRRFGVEGIKWMKWTYDQVQDREIEEIVDTYEYILDTITQSGMGSDRRHYGISVRRDFLNSVIRCRRREALHWLCYLEAEDFYAEGLKQAIPLAMKNGWDEVVLACLEFSQYVDVQDGEGRTFLSYAAELGSDICVRQSIELRARLDLADNNHSTPLIWAVKKGHVEIAMALLSTSQVNPNAHNDKHLTPLWLAADRGDEATIELLVEKGADVNMLCSNTPEILIPQAGIHLGGDRSPLTRAVECGHLEAVRLLLKAGASEKETAEFAILYAIKEGHTAIAQLLLENGATFEGGNPQDWDKQTLGPLILAAMIGQE